MRILISLSILFKCLGIDRFLYYVLSARAANCVARGNILKATALLERLEYFLYLVRSSYLLLTQYRLANLYEQGFRTQDAVILYEGMLRRRRIPIAMSGNIRTRLANIQEGRSPFSPAHRNTASSDAGACYPDPCV
ncbi:hypothetical protein [Capsulimonas corticalis]|nr:hypothetical protein [Capsulimonas corticalis]